jgi:Uma2 family endonuclease
MRSAFPGMDPWIEHPSIWPGVHQRLITYAGDLLQASVGPAYFVAIGERVYVESPASETFYPDVSVVRRHGPTDRADGSGSRGEADQPTVLVVEPIERREVFLEIHDAATQAKIVTVIEVLSPSNKRLGQGRELYLSKQREVLASSASLVEIDLLRGGEPTVAVPASAALASPYRVVVSLAADRRLRQLYSIQLRDRLPRIAVPLLAADTPVVLDLQGLLDQAYENGGYRRRLDYQKPPVPPLAEAELAWARERIASPER